MQFYDWVHTALVFEQIKVEYKGQVGGCFRNISKTMPMSRVRYLPQISCLSEQDFFRGGGGGFAPPPGVWGVCGVICPPPLGYAEISIVHV